MRSAGSRWVRSIRTELLAGLLVLFVSGHAVAQARQPLFQGNPVESIARFGDRIVRSLSGRPSHERRRVSKKASHRDVREGAPPPSIGAVPLPQSRPDMDKAVAGTAGSAALSTRTSDPDVATGDEDKPPALENSLAPTKNAIAVQKDGGPQGGSTAGGARRQEEVKAEPGGDTSPYTDRQKAEGVGKNGSERPNADDPASANESTGSPGDAASTAISVERKPERAVNQTGGKPANEKSDEMDPSAGKENTEHPSADPGARTMAPAAPSPLTGEEAETLPVSEIPTPDKRPAPPPEGGPKPTEGSPPANDAPNSTEKLKSRIPEITPAASVEAAAAVEDAKKCEKELKDRGVEFSVAESISEGECGVLRPIAVKTLSSGVSVEPDTQLLCRSALALDQWMTNSVTKAAETNFPDDPVVRFNHASTYVCRPRSSESKISEHARGSAIDIAGFVLKSGKVIGVEAQGEGTPEAKFQKAVRDGACGPFKTVLGPGTDADHATHFHLDIAARTNGYEYCK